jgi:hypothetical protein
MCGWVVEEKGWVVYEAYEVKINGKFPMSCT